MALLFNVAPNDPRTLAAVAAVIAAVATVACVIPAWRAQRDSIRSSVLRQN